MLRLRLLLWMKTIDCDKVKRDYKKRRRRGHGSNVGLGWTGLTMERAGGRCTGGEGQAEECTLCMMHNDAYRAIPGDLDFATWV